MRHLNAGRPLGVTTAHRRAMLRNLVTSLLEHGRIKTTVARAKELRRPLARMIALGKRGDLHARRQALGFVKSKEAMKALFGEMAERYRERPSGFVRIIRMGFRKGDGAELALVQLVGHENDPFLHEAAPKAKPRKDAGKKGRTKGKPAAKGGTVLEEVAGKVSGKAAEAATAEGEAAGEKAPKLKKAKAKAEVAATAKPAKTAKAEKPAKAAAKAPKAAASKSAEASAPKPKRTSKKKEEE